MLLVNKNCQVAEPEFQGTAQQILLSYYGDPRMKGWGKQWLINWEVQKKFEWFPATNICIHRAFYAQLYRAFIDMEYIGVHKEIKTFNEAFNIRYINGSDSVLSVHSWGVAIDLNADDNPLGGNGTWSKRFIEIMLSHSIYCGQCWTGRTDPMHFSMLNA